MSEEIKQAEIIAEGTDSLEIQQGEHSEDIAVPQEKDAAEASSAPQEKEPEETVRFRDAGKSADTEETAAYRRGNPFKRKTYFGDEEDMAREEWILSRLRDEDLMEYLSLEHRKAEMLQRAKETRERRIFFLMQLLISLASIVAVVYCLQSEPVVLVNILYITGIVIGLWIWKHPKDQSGSGQ